MKINWALCKRVKCPHFVSKKYSDFFIHVCRFKVPNPRAKNFYRISFGELPSHCHYIAEQVLSQEKPK